MGINFNINVNKKKYSYKGKEYESIEDMPGEARAIFEKYGKQIASESLASSIPAGDNSVGSKNVNVDTGILGLNFNVNVNKKFKYNGREYNSLEEMPEEAKEVLKKAGVSGMIGFASSLPGGESVKEKRGVELTGTKNPFENSIKNLGEGSSYDYLLQPTQKNSALPYRIIIAFLVVACIGILLMFFVTKAYIR